MRLLGELNTFGARAYLRFCGLAIAPADPESPTIQKPRL